MYLSSRMVTAGIVTASTVGVAALISAYAINGSGAAKASSSSKLPAAQTSPQDGGGYATDSPVPSDTPTDGTSATPSAAASPSTAPTSGRTTAPPSWKGWLKLSAVDNPVVGRTVVDGKGFVLYRFDKDRPGVSNCFKACSKVWPPVKYTPHMKLSGIDAGQIGNIMTKDGICQATLNGWPIYRYSKDTAPGQVNGQGVGGVWFAIAPNGKKAMGAMSGGMGSSS